MFLLAMTLDSIIKSRRSIRKFKSNKKCKPQNIFDIMNSARMAPCAGGIFSVRLILVEDKNVKKKIAEACLGQNFIVDSSYVVVVVSERKQTERLYGKYASVALRQQAGAAIQNMLLKATELKLACCWVGSLDEQALKRILRVPENVDIEAVIPIGYAAEKAKERKLPSLNSIVKSEKYS